MTMKQRTAVLLMLGLMPLAELHAQSQTVSTTFRVSARVEAVCEVTATDLAFGTYTAQAGTPTQGSTLLRATCTPGTTYNVGLNEGASGGTVNQRKMASGANALNYQLYRDAARSQIWGNTTGTDTVTGVGTGIAQDHTVFGAVPAAQVVPAGDYQDTITVRVYY
jgi:spore coat protein U-like protein